MTIAGLIVVLLSFPLARSLMRLSPGASLLISIATGTSIFLAQYSFAFLRSETLFTALFLAALLAGEGWRRDRGFGRAALSALLIGLATLVRTAGVVGVAAIALARVVGLRPLRVDLKPRTLGEMLLFVGLAALPQALFTARNATLPETGRSSGYLDELLAPYALDLTKDIDVGIERIGWLSPEMARRVEGNLFARRDSARRISTSRCSPIPAAW